jgi:hypothetical protein
MLLEICASPKLQARLECDGLLSLSEREGCYVRIPKT